MAPVAMHLSPVMVVTPAVRHAPSPSVLPDSDDVTVSVRRCGHVAFREDSQSDFYVPQLYPSLHPGFVPRPGYDKVSLYSLISVIECKSATNECLCGVLDYLRRHSLARCLVPAYRRYGCFSGKSLVMIGDKLTL
jgi:hypothetical protein